MSEPTESIYTDFISYAESLDTSGKSEMLVSRIIPSFLLSVRHYNISEFSDLALKYWYVDMMLREIKPSTAKRYITALHTLYKEWAHKDEASSDESDPFNEIIPKISMKDVGDFIGKIDRNVDNISNITKITAGLKGDKLIVNNAFQFLMYDPMISIPELINFKFSDSFPDSPHLTDIVTLMRKMPQAKYVFPLQQGKKREPAIVKGLVSSLHSAARNADMDFGSYFSRESITSLWIHSALQIEIPASSILSVVKKLPPEYEFLNIFDKEILSEEETVDILNRVADSINNKTPRWFVMKLRSGVTPDNIKDRLEQLKSPVRRLVQYFYPMRQQKKMKNKKVITVETPYLPDLLFFRIGADMVSRLMSGIGDLAWCFRTSSKPLSPYSIISQEEMALFQRCIGSFTSDVEMEIISELPKLKVGDKVYIDDGSMFAGKQATIRKVESKEGTITYTLRLSDTSWIRWEDIKRTPIELSETKP